MPSLSQIARRAGVSKSTVSLVLNNRPNVTEAMRHRVLQALEELQRESAAPEKTAPLNVLLIHPIALGSQQVFRELLQGVQAGVEAAGARLTLAVHQPPLQPDHATHALLHDRALRPNGVIVMGARLNDPILDEVRRENLPCLLLGRERVPPDVSAVGLDNVGGARLATQHLIELGHKTIAFLGGDVSFDYTGLRQQGYCEALRAAQLSDEGLVFLGAGADAARAFLAAKTTVTAIVFVNDEHMVNALPVLARAGLRVPRDLSVVGFDDTERAARFDPPLTSVAVPRALIGYWGGKTIVDCIRCRELQTARLTFRPHLVERASCCALGGPIGNGG